MSHHEILLAACKSLPEDYRPWGDTRRWENQPETGECSWGCKFYYPLQGKRGDPIWADWGVCANPKSHRCGLLTFEHQGCPQFECKKK